MPHELLKRFCYPSFGANGFYNTVADVPIGAPVIDTTDGNKLKKCVYGFENRGADSVNLGRPSYVSGIIDMNSPFTVLTTFKLVDIDPVSILFGNSGDAFGVRTLLRINNAVADHKYYGQVRGAPNLPITPLFTSTDWVTVGLTSNGSTFKIILPDGTLSAPVAVGAGVSVGNFLLMALDFEGDFLKFEIYSGESTDGTCDGLTWVDTVDFSDESQWDGGAAGVSKAGNPFTVTDGVPTPARQKMLIPVELLKC